MEQSRWRREERAYGCINVPRVHIYTYIYIYIYCTYLSHSRRSRRNWCSSVEEGSTGVNYSFPPRDRVDTWYTCYRLIFYTRSLFLVLREFAITIIGGGFSEGTPRYSWKEDGIWKASMKHSNFVHEEDYDDEDYIFHVPRKYLI